MNKTPILKLLFALSLSCHYVYALADRGLPEDFNRYDYLNTDVWNEMQNCPELNSIRNVDRPAKNNSYQFGIDEYLHMPVVRRGQVPCSLRNAEPNHLFKYGPEEVAEEEMLSGPDGYEIEDDPDPLPLVTKQELKIESVLNKSVKKPAISQSDKCLSYNKFVPTAESKQKNELRLLRDFWPKALSYSHFTFKMKVGGSIEPCGSRRSVIGQWKVWPSGDSPFLAQRYDNGVLHITMQDKFCRCTIAKSPGDQNAMPGAPAKPEYASLTSGYDTGGPIGACSWTASHAMEKEDEDYAYGCKFRPKITPLGSRLIENPKNGWTKFDYHILFKENNQNFLVIYQNDRPVVRVDGPFAYNRTESDSQLNFKIGIYQDIQRGGITLDVDDVDVNEYSADSKEFRQFLAETSR